MEEQETLPEPPPEVLPGEPASEPTGKDRKKDPARKQPVRGRRKWREKFLAALSRSMNVTASAIAAGVSRNLVYVHRLKDPKFAQQWDDAVEQAVDVLEMQAYRLAAGTKADPARGIEAAPPDARMLIFMLSRRRRAVYGDRSQLEVTGAGGGPIAHVEREFTEAERLAAVQELYARMGSQSGGAAAAGETGTDRSLLAGSNLAPEAGGKAPGSLAGKGAPLNASAFDAALLASGGEIDSCGSFSGEDLAD